MKDLKTLKASAPKIKGEADKIKKVSHLLGLPYKVAMYSIEKIGYYTYKDKDNKKIFVEL